jgi:hypothetical protein
MFGSVLAWLVGRRPDREQRRREQWHIDRLAAEGEDGGEGVDE